MASPSRKTVQVEVRLVRNELVGGDVEQRPYLATHGTWRGANRVQRSATLDEGGAWTPVAALPTAHATHPDDDRVWLCMYAHTRYSGIPEIDTTEGPSVWRQIAAGCATVRLKDLVAAGAHGVKLDIVEDIVERTVIMNITQRSSRPGFSVADVKKLARRYATKATIIARIKPAEEAGRSRLLVEEVDDDDDTASSSTDDDVPRLTYGSPQLDEAGRRLFARLDAAYLKRVTDIPVATPLAAGERWPCNPNEPLVSALHLAQWTTPTGRLPAFAFAMQDESSRADASRSAPRDTSLAYIEASLMSSALRQGMTRDAYVRTINAQLERRDDVVLSSLYTALKVAAGLGTFAANSVHYAADRRYPNVRWLEQQPANVRMLLAPDVYGRGGDRRHHRSEDMGTTTRMARLASGALHPRVVLAALSDASDRAVSSPSRNGSSPPPPPLAERLAIPCESWDMVPFAGVVNTADCEDTGFGAAGVLQTTAALANAATPEQRVRYPMVAATGRLLERFYPHATGATVTEPYVKSTADGKKVIAPAPRIGSAEDRKRTEAGHSYALLEAAASLTQRYLSGIDAAPIHPEDQARVHTTLQRALDAAAPWERRVVPLILEGTAPLDGEVLPAEETYAGTDRGDLFVRKAAAKIDFVRRGMAKSDARFAALAQFVRFPVQTDDVAATRDPRLRVSKFYRTMVHSLAAPMGALVGPLLTHTVAVDLHTKTRGPDIGAYMRDAASGSKRIALVHAYGGAMSQRAWQRDGEPYVRAHLRQLPPTSWARTLRSDKADVAQLIPTGTVMKLAAPALRSATTLGALGSTGEDALAALPKPAAADVALIERADESSTHVALPLYVPTWKLSALGEERVREMVDALDTMRRDGTLSAYAWLHDRSMPHLDAFVTLVVALPVSAASSTVKK